PSAPTQRNLLIGDWGFETEPTADCGLEHRPEAVVDWSTDFLQSSIRNPSIHDHSVDHLHRQSYDVGVTAFYAFDKARGMALNAVSAGLVHRLSGRNVPFNFVVAHLGELDASDGDFGEDLFAINESDACQHFVPLSAEQPQHPPRVIGVNR